MFKVLIVEDEPPIIRTLKKIIESTDGDFVVVQSCMNGKAAVECLEKEDFDVVLTDIRMPIMSGIELAGHIYENYPDTKVVLVSGHQDFEYARKALEYKVFDYILKPVSKDKVKDLLVRIKRENEKQYQITAKSNDSAPNAAALFCAGAYLLYGSQVLLPGDGFWADGTLESYLDENLNENESYHFYNSGIGSERLLLLNVDTTERREQIIKVLYECVIGRELPVTVVYKTNIQDENVPQILSFLRHRLFKYLVLDKSGLISCDNEQEGFEYIQPPYTKNDIEAIVLSIFNGNENDVRTRIFKHFSDMNSIECTQEEVNNFLNVILDTYRLTYPNKIQRKYLSVKHEFVNAIAAYESFDKFVEDIVSILMTLKNDIAQADRYEVLADSIEAYLLENYNQSITNDILAEKFGFVPSYISRIFKRQKGASPNEYITNYRIEIAKKLILKNHDLRINEISDMVGFKEPYYFSKVFKRKTGVWPTEYGK